MTGVLEQVEQFCLEHGLLHRGDRIVAACSGGPDSLALLVILWQLRRKYDLQIVAAHFEHGIRGAASKADADFVQAFCQQRGIPVQLAATDVPKEAAAQGLSLETAARELRYRFLEQVRQTAGFDAIAVAHHADDQAETVLMRILRGTGTQGLAAMRPRSGKGGTIIRPLLGVTKAAIRAFCAAQGLQPCEDATNEQATEYIEAQVEALWQDTARVRQQPLALNQQGFSQLPLALQRGLVRRFWQAAAGSRQDLGFGQAEKLRLLLRVGQTSSQLELSHGFVARLAYGWLTCAQRPETAAAPAPADLQIPGCTQWGSYLCTAEWCAEIAPAPTPWELYLQPDDLAEPLVIRQRESGDAIQLPGGRKKLKKLLIDDKIPQQERDQLPILAAGHEVLWVAGHRRSTRCAVAFDRPLKRRVLYLRLERREEIYHDER